MYILLGCTIILKEKLSIFQLNTYLPKYLLQFCSYSRRGSRQHLRLDNDPKLGFTKLIP